MRKLSNNQESHPSRTSRPQRTVRRGFTLIELLVVIAIIALLVSILLPSLQQAKDLAKRMQCMANLRTLGTAFNFYYEDWGMYPMGWNDLGSAGWPSWKDGDTRAWDEVFEPYDVLRVSYLARESYWPERATRQYHCPSWEIPTYADAGGCYGYNQFVSNGPYVPGMDVWSPEYLKDTPAGVALVGGTINSTIMVSQQAAEAYAPDTLDQQPDFRHAGDTCNFMFSDAHAETRTSGEVPYGTFENDNKFWSPAAYE